MNQEAILSDVVEPGVAGAPETAPAAAPPETAPAAPPLDLNAVIAEISQKAEETSKSAVEEALKKAALPEEERRKLEQQEREQALAAREQALAKREIEQDAKRRLTEKGIPDAFAAFVTADTPEATTARIDALKTAFDAAVLAEAKKRAAGVTPLANQTQAAPAVSKYDQLKKLLKNL